MEHRQHPSYSATRQPQAIAIAATRSKPVESLDATFSLTLAISYVAVVMLILTFFA